MYKIGSYLANNYFHNFHNCPFLKEWIVVDAVVGNLTDGYRQRARGRLVVVGFRFRIRGQARGRLQVAVVRLLSETKLKN
jgi:hypothetical protein